MLCAIVNWLLDTVRICNLKQPDFFSIFSKIIQKKEIASGQFSAKLITPGFKIHDEYKYYLARNIHQSDVSYIKKRDANFLHLFNIIGYLQSIINPDWSG